MNSSVWVWAGCAVALLIAAALAFAGDVYPAMIMIVLVVATLVAYRVR